MIKLLNKCRRVQQSKFHLIRFQLSTFKGGIEIRMIAIVVKESVICRCIAFIGSVLNKELIVQTIINLNN